MGLIGGSNPIPFVLGGEPSDVHAGYKALRSLVGPSNAAQEDVPGDTIEGSWRWAKAQGIAASVADDRALFNALPDRATDLIPMYEDILALAASSSSSDETRRQDILARWVASASAVSESLEDSLQAIDPLFSLVYGTREDSAETENGRGFEDYNPAAAGSAGPAFGGRKSTDFPNASTHFIVTVLYDLPVGTITAEQQRRIETAKTLLCRVLPSWVTFQFITAPATGFILDQSLLDLGAFNP